MTQIFAKLPATVAATLGSIVMFTLATGGF